jgi:FtsH-binding integral membrane protein
MRNFSSAFSSTETKSFDIGLRNYMLKVYNYMAIGLLITAVTAFATVSFEPLAHLMFNINETGYMTGYTGFGILIMIAPVGIALYFFSGTMGGNMSISSAQMWFWIYAALTGMSLSALAFVYTGESIAKTFFITASVFGGMSLYGYTTGRDLTSLGSFLIMGLMGIILASLVNLFFHSPAISFATSFIGVFIFMGLIAWDTQKIKAMYYASGGGESGQRLAIAGAFGLYLDFINLFVHLIRFFGTRRD